VKRPEAWFKNDLYCVIDLNNRVTIIDNQYLV